MLDVLATYVNEVVLNLFLVYSLSTFDAFLQVVPVWENMDVL